MRGRNLLPAGLALAVSACGSASAQPPSADASIQFHKELELGRQLATELDRHDSTIKDPVILGYLQRIANRVASAAGATPPKVRVTRGLDRYARLMPQGTLYISATLLTRVENEAELAGLFAHLAGHAAASASAAQGNGGDPVFSWPDCILAAQLSPVKPAEEHREAERSATAFATQTLRAAGYDPTAVLDLLSKLAYENPAWAKAIAPHDLLDLRLTLEAQAPPRAGYVVDSSAFALAKTRVAQAMK